MASLEIVTSITANQRALQEVRQELALSKNPALSQQSVPRHDIQVDGPASWNNEMQSKRENAARRVESKYINEARGTPSDSSLIPNVHGSLSGNLGNTEVRGVQRPPSKLQLDTSSGSHVANTMSKASNSYVRPTPANVQKNVRFVPNTIAREQNACLAQSEEIKIPNSGASLPHIAERNLTDRSRDGMYAGAHETPLCIQVRKKKPMKTNVLSNEDLIPSNSKPILVVGTEIQEANSNENTPLLPNIATRNTEFAPSYSKRKRLLKVFEEDEDMVQATQRSNRGMCCEENPDCDLTLPKIRSNGYTNVPECVGNVEGEYTVYQTDPAFRKLPSLAQSAKVTASRNTVHAGPPHIVAEEGAGSVIYKLQEPFQQKCFSQQPARGQPLRDTTTRKAFHADQHAKPRQVQLPVSDCLPEITSSARRAVPKPTWNSLTAKRGVGFKSKLKREQ